MTSYEERIEAIACAIVEDHPTPTSFTWAELPEESRELYRHAARAADAACLAAIEEPTEELIKNIAWAIENCQDYGPDHVTEYRGPDDWEQWRDEAKAVHKVMWSAIPRGDK